MSEHLFSPSSVLGTTPIVDDDDAHEQTGATSPSPLTSGLIQANYQRPVVQQQRTDVPQPFQLPEAVPSAPSAPSRSLSYIKQASPSGSEPSNWIRFALIAGGVVGALVVGYWAYLYFQSNKKNERGRTHAVGGKVEAVK